MTRTADIPAYAFEFDNLDLGHAFVCLVNVHGQADVYLDDHAECLWCEGVLSGTTESVPDDFIDENWARIEKAILDQIREAGPSHEPYDELEGGR